MKLYFIGFLHELLRRHRRLLGVLLLGVFLPWAIFLKVSSEIREGEGFYGDLQALRWLHAHATPTLDTLNLLLSRAGGPLVMAGLSGLIAGGLLWWRQRRKAWFFGVAVGGSAVINLLAKWVLGRARPALWTVLAPETSSSFPSGHAMGTAALALTLGLMLAHARARWLAWVLGAGFVLGVGFSRVYLGVHYPSDVLSGWIASVGWVTGVYVLFSPYGRELRTIWGTVRQRHQAHRHRRAKTSLPPG